MEAVNAKPLPEGSLDNKDVSAVLGRWHFVPKTPAGYRASSNKVFQHSIPNN